MRYKKGDRLRHKGTGAEVTVNYIDPGGEYVVFQYGKNNSTFTLWTPDMVEASWALEPKYKVGMKVRPKHGSDCYEIVYERNGQYVLVSADAFDLDAVSRNAGHLDAFWTVVE